MLLKPAGKLSEAAPHDPLASGRFSIGSGRGTLRSVRRVQVAVARFGSAKRTRRRSTSAEIDHMLACYDELRARRPELAQGEIIVNVAKELRWAKRRDDEERFYRETVQGATQIGQIAGAMDLAGRARRRGGADPAFRAIRPPANRSLDVAYATASYHVCPVDVRSAREWAFVPSGRIFPGLQAARFQPGSRQAEEQQQTPGAAARARRRESPRRRFRGSCPRSIGSGRGSVPDPIDYPQDNEYL